MEYSNPVPDSGQNDTQHTMVSSKSDRVYSLFHEIQKEGTQSFEALVYPKFFIQLRKLHQEQKLGSC